MGTRIKEDCYIKVIRTIQKYELIKPGDKLVGTRLPQWHVPFGNF